MIAVIGARAGTAQWPGHARYVTRTWPLLGEATGAVLGSALDSLGYLHLATGGGLLRFDGRRVALQSMRELPQLAANSVLSVAASGQGVWAGTPDGTLLHIVGGRVRDSLSPFTGSGEAVRMVALRRDGEPVVASDHHVLRHSAGGWVPIAWPAGGAGSTVASLLVNRDGLLYAGTRGGLFVTAGDGFRPVDLPGRRNAAVLALAEDPAGDLWISTTDGLFVRRAAGPIVPVGRPPVMSSAVMAIASDDEGVLWFGGGFGVVAAAVLRDGRAPQLEPVYVASSGATDTPVMQLLSDGRGSVVATTSARGLRIITRSPVRSLGMADGLGDRVVHSIVGDGAGGFWVQSGCGGVTHFGVDGVRRYSKPELGIRNACVRSILRDSLGAIWLGQAMRVSRAGRDGRVLDVPFGATDAVNVGPMLAEPDGSVLMGVRPHGLRRVDAQGRVSVPSDAGRLPTTPIWSLARSADGALWVGQVGTVTRLDGAASRTFDGDDAVPPGQIRVLLPDRDGTVWIGAYGGGLARFRDGHVARLTTRNGLFDDALSAIVPDGKGRLWLMGNRGVSVVRRTQLDSVVGGRAERVEGVTLDSQAGVPEGNGGHPAGWTDGQRFYFGSVDGVTVVDPRVVDERRHAPSVVFESVRLPDGEHALDGELVVRASTRGAAVRVAAPSLGDEAVQLRYRVKGAHAGWTELGPDRLLPLDNLPPGRAFIEVAARDELGGWSARPTELLVDVRGRWWQSLAFRLLVLVLAALGAASLARVRIREAEAHARELRREIARREHAEAESQARLHDLAHISRVALAGELATSLAHELNQPLAAIVSNADAARRMLTMPGSRQEGDDIDDVLRDISAEGKRASGVIRTLREFLRRGSREFVPVELAATVAEVLPVLRHLLQREQVTIVVHGATELPPVLGDRVALQQVLMNLIVNAVEAMQDTAPELRLIEVEGRQRDGQVLLCVRDHGPGVPPDRHESIFRPFATTKPDGMGMGLAISRSIVEAHGGELEVSNAADGGAQFCLSLPEAPRS